VVGDSARGEISRGAWETLSVGANATNAPREYITVARPGRESERPILAKKRGNAGSTPCFTVRKGRGKGLMSSWCVTPMISWR